MCSIAGITNDNPTDVTLMLKTMRHRAPDDLGVYNDRNISLGMGRLSIICLLYTSPSPRDRQKCRMPSSG